MAAISTAPGHQLIQPADVAEIVRTSLRLSPHAHIEEVVIHRTDRSTPGT
jgi:NADP-dependent 3-hydroxy acid dehydrogenase YdfG